MGNGRSCFNEKKPFQVLLITLFFLFVVGVYAQKGNNGDYDEKEFGKTFKSQFATVNKIKLHYVIGGKGEPIVLIHGYPETWFSWHKIMPSLAEKHTVIAVDLRGLGESEVTPTGYDKRTVAEDVHQLLESLKIGKFKLVSHDWGGAVAYSLANAYPETVSSLVVIESAVPGFGLEQFMDVAKGGSWHFGFFMSEFAEKLTKGREREFLTDFAFKGKYVFNKNAFSQKEIDVYLNSYTKPGGMTAGFNYYRTALDDAKYNQANFKEKLKMPVLAIGGEKSFGEAVATSLKLVAENVKSVVIKDSGHFVAEEQPEELTKQLLQFYAE
ncbi:MAG: alpha/beta hydrolase [Actinomycetota bacterium]